MLSASVMAGSHGHQGTCRLSEPLLGHVKPTSRRLECQAGSGDRLLLKQQLEGWSAPIGSTVASGVCEWQAFVPGVSGTISKRDKWQPHHAGERRQHAGIQLHAP